MSLLKQELRKQIPKVQNEIKQLIVDKGDEKISDVTVAQAFSGLRGIKAFVCDTSSVSADKGLIIRGIPLLEITHILPEEVFFLLLTGRLPNKDELVDLKIFKKKAKLPQKEINIDKQNDKVEPNLESLVSTIIKPNIESSKLENPEHFKKSEVKEKESKARPRLGKSNIHSKIILKLKPAL